MMRAVTLKNFGGPEVLTISEVKKPIAAAEQLLVKVKATALNRADLLQRRGKYSPPSGAPEILGLEIAGTVEAIGSDVTLFQPGDRVCGLVPGGAYTEYCLIDQYVAMPIPPTLSFTDAAGIPEAFLTAHEAIFSLGQLKKTETILIHAGGSGVGTAGIQLAHALGATIFTTVGSAQKKLQLETFHPNAIIDYKQQNFAEEIQKLTVQQGVNLIIDFIGANYFADNIKSLAVDGRLICVGLMGGASATIHLDQILMRRLQIKGLSMRSRPLQEKRLFTQYFIEHWLPLFNQGKLKPVIDSIFSFAEVRQAHEYMESNKNFGKIILEIQ